MTWHEVPRELSFLLSRLLLVLFGASGHFVEFKVFLVVAETVASPLFFVFWGVSFSVFSLSCISSFGDFTRSQHQEITNNFKSVKKKTGILAHLYMDTRIFKKRIIMYTVCCK